MTEQSDGPVDQVPGDDAGGRIPPPGPWPKEADRAQPAWTGSGEPKGSAWAPDTAGAADSAATAGSWSASGDAIGSGIEHPEIVIGAAFVGGLLLAMLLKRLAR
jgi:hypothetical protein